MTTTQFSFSKRPEGVVEEEEEEEEEWTKLDHPVMPLSPKRPQTLVHGRKSTVKDGVDSDTFGLVAKHGRYVDNLDSRSSDSSPSATVYDSSSLSIPPHPYSQQHAASLPSRHRTSILSVASDALGFRKKFSSVSRKKQNTHPLPHSTRIMPGVIEINAHNNTTVTSTVAGTTAHRDCEHEERERLRDVAAQSIGLDPGLLQPQSPAFLDSPHSPIQPAPLPPFPATLLALRPFTEMSATLPKFTPPSSLLVYALARQWKLRTIVLTSHSPTHQTHVHLFKGNSKDEKEIERLEVTEDSVIFVADEEVGGRGNVVKLAGRDVSPKQGGPIAEETLRSMWFLHIQDPAESHRWIATVKDAVLTQRAARAGLDIPSQSDGANEPKGDMDVMLSMHLQRNISTHPIKASPTISIPSQLVSRSPSPPPSLRSLRINTSSPSPTTTMKGIFSGTRSRSPSVEGSPTLTHPPGHAEDSFSAAGTSLLTMLRNKSSADSSLSPSHSLPRPLPRVPGQSSPAPSVRSAKTPVIITASDLKISKERDAPDQSSDILEASSSSTTPGSNIPPTPSLSPSLQGTLTVSLQPPPRKCNRAVTTNPTPLPQEPQGMYKQPRGNSSVAGNFGIPSTDPGDLTPRGTSPTFPNTSNSSSGQVGSLVPSSGSGASLYVGVEAHNRGKSDEVMRDLLGNGNIILRGNGSVPSDRLLQGTGISKRWSRQVTPLPKQLTPPSGPPPSIPPSPESNSHRISMESGISIPVTYIIDRSPSSSSSNFHSRAQFSVRSGSSLSPTFWKRTSSSSTQSASSNCTSDSRGLPQKQIPYGGEYFPSTVGSAIINGASSRPISMSVHGSSPAVHIGTAKRRSMPPPRPAPNFAPPPTPMVRESTSASAPLTMPAPVTQKSFRSSVAQRALRLSLTSPRPPPSSALPPRPDEPTFVQGHRSSSTGESDSHPVPASSRPTSPPSRGSTPVQRTSPPPRSLSIRQRLRILSTPPTQSSSSLPVIPPIQVSTLDLSDDNSDDLPTPCYPPPQPFGLGEHIMAAQRDEDPSFLQLSTPITPTIPKSPFRLVSSPSGVVSGWGTPDFIALSPPPPRRSSKPHTVAGTRVENLDAERSESAQREESQLVNLSHRASAVSLGFVTT